MQNSTTYQIICQAIEDQKNQFGAETLDRFAETRRLFELTQKALTWCGMILDGYISEREFAHQFDLMIEKWLESGQKLYDEKEGGVNEP
jgi:hypothetical protein